MSDSEKKGPDSPIDRTVTDYEVGMTEAVSGELATIIIPGIDAVFEEQAGLVNHAVQLVIGWGRCSPGWLWLDV